VVSAVRFAFKPLDLFVFDQMLLAALPEYQLRKGYGPVGAELDGEGRVFPARVASHGGGKRNAEDPGEGSVHM